MATHPGEWYEEQRLEAERLEHELVGARAVLAALQGVERADMLTAARRVVIRLERRLESARDVGD